MSIREHRPGIWQVRVYVGYDPETGRRRLKTRHVRGPKAAARRVEAQMRAGVEVDDTAPEDTREPSGTAGADLGVHTVGETVEAVIDHLEVIGRAPKTIYDYRCLSGLIAGDEIAGIAIGDLRARDVDLYYGRLVRAEVTPARIRKHHSLLRTSAGWAVRWEWCDRNVVRDATPPTVHGKRATAPETAVVARVLAKVDGYDPSGVRGVAIRLLAMLGCRRGEVCALRWSDVDLNGGRVHIHSSRDDTPGAPSIKGTKTHQDRFVPIDKTTVKLLKAHQRAMKERAMAAGVGWCGDGFVLSDVPDSSVPLRPDVVSKAWSRARDRAGVEGVTLMDVRHWAATRMIDAGIDPVVVASILGHADPATTRRFYAAATDRARQQAGEVLGSHLGQLGG